MLDATNIRILDRFDMNTGYRAVVQKGNVGSKYVYGLQLRNNQTETHVLRGFRGNPCAYFSRCSSWTHPNLGIFR